MIVVLVRKAARQTGNPTFAKLFTDKTRRIAGALPASARTQRPAGRRYP